MTDIEYKGKKYAFSWWGIVIFAVFCPLLAIIIIFILESIWQISFPPLIQPVTDILNLLSNSTWSYSIVDGNYTMNIPNTLESIYFVSECIGIQGYAIYAGISIFTPHNKYKTEGKNVYVRKLVTIIVPCLLLYLANIIRSVVTLLIVHNGLIPTLNPMHEYIGYITTFFAVFSYYCISYFWLPEFSLFLIWMKDDIKAKITERRMKKTVDKEKEITEKKYQVKKLYLLLFWAAVMLILTVVMIELIVHA